MYGLGYVPATFSGYRTRPELYSRPRFTPGILGAMTAASADWASELRHVAKTYRGRVQALQGIALHVRRGEVFGLLGPNGAGKSTLVKILMTVVRPTRAEGTLLM